MENQGPWAQRRRLEVGPQPPRGFCSRRVARAQQTRSARCGWWSRKVRSPASAAQRPVRQRCPAKLSLGEQERGWQLREDGWDRLWAQCSVFSGPALL